MHRLESFAICTLGCLVIMGFGSVANGQPGTQLEPEESSLNRGSFTDQFWKYLTYGPNAYDEWGPLPTASPGIVDSKSPHGPKVRIIANRKARSDVADMPHGSILIKENFREDGKSLLSVTIMYRSQGYDPLNNDWFWVKYLPDGSVDRLTSESNGLPIAGRVTSCISCHASAGGDDFVFSND